jgi:hypothetical protein
MKTRAGRPKPIRQSPTAIHVLARIDLHASDGKRSPIRPAAAGIEELMIHSLSNSPLLADGRKRGRNSTSDLISVSKKKFLDKSALDRR